MSGHPFDDMPKLDVGITSETWVQWKLRTRTLQGTRINRSRLHRIDDRERSRTACDHEVPRLGDQRLDGRVLEIQLLNAVTALGSSRRCAECEATLR